MSVLDIIEDTYDKYKNKPKTCEKELIKLRDSIKVDVKTGKIEENHFIILEKKLDDHLNEVRTSLDEGVVKRYKQHGRGKSASGRKGKKGSKVSGTRSSSKKPSNTRGKYVKFDELEELEELEELDDDI